MRTLQLFVFLFIISFSGFTQDLIRFKNGDELQGKVIEIFKDSVDFALQDSTSVLRIAKLDLAKLRYDKGVEMYFDEAAATPLDAPEPSRHSDDYARGMQDADSYYTRYRAASNGTLVAGIMSPMLALIPAIACSSTTPQRSNLDIPDPAKNSSLDYINGYSVQARKIKSKKVWKGYGIGAGIGVGVRVVYIAAVAILVSSVAFD